MAELAVNVNEEPSHDGLFPEVMAIVTVGVNIGLILNVILFEETVAGIAHV